MQAESQSVTRHAEDQIISSVSQRYTNVPLIPSFIIAIVGGSAMVGAALLVKNNLPHLHALLMERGPVQFITIYAFWFTVGMLLLKYRHLKRERLAFNLDFIKSFTAGQEAVGTKTILAHQQSISENLEPRQKDLILVSRINKAIKQLRINHNPADVANVLKTVAETDAAVVDSSYVLIKFMIWAIPVMGFIGTIIGMTQAIGSFDTVLKGINEVGFAGVKQSLGTVTGGLAVAFETTFLALVLSAIVNLFSNAMQKKEEDLLSDIEEFTTDNIINKYTTLRDRMASGPIHPSGSSPEPESGAETADIVRELKNLNKQQKINTDELLAQLGRLIGAIEKNGLRTDTYIDRSVTASTLMPVLDELGKALKGQAEYLKKLDDMSELIQKNMEVMNHLPDTLDELRETSHKLGELFAKIYNRTFA